ncbi:MAG: phenylalanine--tRNA ligase subunit beta [Atopococcus tabaci]|uniref:Phenylalanine--tRNA ligase beta subunit n=1 Tax=Atopococcus tabaci TaxID=269774 RepID=A0AA43RK86_9LACT|nr:phenylalanine--tRNA ligase subunit beta [Atopococcus tabaci]
MLVSFNWLKEYLDLSDVDPIELGDQLSLTGIEVEHVYQPGEDISRLLVGEIIECTPIPDTHLHAAKVNVGRDELQEIVCGAPNVAQGQKVIVAMPGARLPGGMEIGEREMQGYPSNGMICSLQELGFPEKVVPKQYVEGIYVLPDDIMVGEDAKPVLGLDDTIFDFDLTPNRSDALSMRGVAHEVGAILSQIPEFEKIELTENKERHIEEILTVGVDNAEDAPIYSMRIIEDLQVQESPMWLQRKLMAVGMRPIDNLVDITNYIMMEYGQPLHAFDKDLIRTDQIVVRRAEEGERLITLDGKERQLDPENIVITDGEKPIALGGVMGGENTHISHSTQHVALEAAVFNPLQIRRTAGKLNLRSEASSRFEKGINLAVVTDALNHAAQLLSQLGDGKVVSGMSQVAHVTAENTEINLTVSYLNNVIGVDLTKIIIFDIFDRLQFDYKDGEGDSFTVIIPPRRWDIKIKADVAEEVARIYGYNNLPNTLPVGASIPGKLSVLQKMIRQTNRYMEGSGFNQAITYSLTTKEKANQFSIAESDDTNLAMPLSEEHETLRKSILPGLLDSAKYNRARSTDSIFLYETGRIYHGTPGDSLLDELEHVSALATGNYIEDWTNEVVEMDFFTLKGILEGLLESYNLAEEVEFRPLTVKKGMHPGRTAGMHLHGHEFGFIGQIHPKLANSLDLEDVYVFEFDLQLIHDAEKASRVVEDIPKYPGITRDAAVLVNKRISHSEIVEVIEKVAGPWLQSVNLFDYYEGEGIDDKKKSLAYSLFYQNPNATLLEEEVQEDFERVLKSLKNELNAQIR